MSIVRFSIKKAISMAGPKGYKLTMSLPSTEGQEFLLGYTNLRKNLPKYTEEEVLQYLLLASMRSYSDYRYNNKTSLSMDLVPISASSVNANSLLDIRNNEVFFLYEEEAKNRDNAGL